MKKILLFLILACIVTTTLVGCSKGPNSDGEAKDQIGIRGVIKSIDILEDGAILLVEGDIEEDTMHDRASVRIDNDTTIEGVNSGDKMKIADIDMGDTVEIIFAGPVAESYPVQGTAKTVKIIATNTGP